MGWSEWSKIWLDELKVASKTGAKIDVSDPHGLREKAFILCNLFRGLRWGCRARELEAVFSRTGMLNFRTRVLDPPVLWKGRGGF